MPKLGKLAALLVFLAGFTLGAFADGITLNFTGAGSEVLGGAYIAPYFGQLSVNGGAYGSELVFICDDYTHDIEPGDVWNVSVTSLAGGNLSGTRFGATFGLQGYEEVAWLASQMGTGPGHGPNAEYQFAIWKLFYPSLDISGLGSNAAQSDAYYAAITSDINQARLNAGSVNLSNWNVVTPLANTGQEFLMPAPEPGTLALIATGIVGALGKSRAWKRRRGSAS